MVGGIQSTRDLPGVEFYNALIALGVAVLFDCEANQGEVTCLMPEGARRLSLGLGVIGVVTLPRSESSCCERRWELNPDPEVLTEQASADLRQQVRLSLPGRVVALIHPLIMPVDVRSCRLVRDTNQWSRHRILDSVRMSCEQNSRETRKGGGRVPYGDRVPVATGPRLALASFAEADFDAVHAFASDPVVCQFTTWGPNTEQETRAFIAQATMPTTDGYLLAVMLGGVVIGSAAVWTTTTDDLAGEIGYAIRSDYWGRGYGTEVATMLVRLGFERLGLERVAATCAPDNVGSVRVLERAGLRQEGMIRGHVRLRGTRRDSLLFGRLVTDS